LRIQVGVSTKVAAAIDKAQKERPCRFLCGGAFLALSGAATMTAISNSDMLITIFGASGFLGQHVVRALAGHGSDVGVSCAEVKAELLGRVIHVPAHRYVGDRGPFSEYEGPPREPLVDDRNRDVDASLEEGEHRGVA